MSDQDQSPHSIRAKNIEAKMAALQNRAERNLDSIIFPWWHSGSACLAALLWLSFVGLLFAVTLGYAENSNANTINILWVAILACIISATASKG